MPGQAGKAGKAGFYVVLIPLGFFRFSHTSYTAV